MSCFECNPIPDDAAYGAYRTKTAGVFGPDRFMLLDVVT